LKILATSKLVVVFSLFCHHCHLDVASGAKGFEETRLKWNSLAFVPEVR